MLASKMKISYVSAALFAHAKAFEMMGSEKNTDTGMADGIWTDFDWQNTQISITNGVPTGKTDSIDRKIQSPQVLMGQFPSSSVGDQTNVSLVKTVFPSDKWDTNFKEPYTYDNFLRAVAKFPKFCNEIPTGSSVSQTDICKREVAALLGHIFY
mmetsp:Transcript_10910/g.14710  ORF Transcript_10910/g.14710 Transcript_10910/m.14710 type:complete len:154 (+) Transcript_10910:41-502(+)